MAGPSSVFRQLAPWRQALLLHLEAVALDAVLTYQRAVFERSGAWPTAVQALAAIRAEILKGAPGAREIGDRAEAIRFAVGELKAGDVLVVAGKGHETGQIVGDRTLPFSDHEQVRAAIAGRSA